MKRRNDRRVHLIASLGGHLELLQALAPVLRDHRRTWLTSEGSRADALRRDGEDVLALPRLDRGSLGVASVWAGVRAALRERPSLVVTSGAGIAVPFAVTARLLGARLVFLEPMARVTSGSMTGRLLSRIGARVFVQWPDLREVYPRATVCRPMLLEDVGDGGGAPGSGTFVTVGSHDVAFDRLLEAVDQAADEGLLPAPVTVQRGVSTRSQRTGRSVPFLSPEEFAAAMGAAEIVVTHAGDGAVATALRLGKVPLVMARDAKRGEHVDGHQAELVTRLEDLGLVVAVDERISTDLVARARKGPHGRRPETHHPRVADALAAALA